MWDDSDFVFQRLLKIFEEDPHYVSGYFLDEEKKSLSLSHLIENTKKLAGLLKEKGVEEGDRVIISLPTSQEFLYSFFALWWIGAIPVPLPEPAPLLKKGSFQERLTHVLSDCQPKGMIVLEQGEKDLQSFQSTEACSSICIWNLNSLSNSLPNSLIDGQKQGNDSPFLPTEKGVAFIQYTSGSTGFPKGVVVTHESLRANVQAMGEASHMNPEDRFLSWLPVYHDMGLIGGILWPAYWKVPYYLMKPSTFLSKPGFWIESMSQHQASFTTAPNFAYNLCARHVRPEDIPHLDLSHWRVAYNGAEPVKPETLSAFSKKFGPYGFSEKTFYPVYGMAEATLAVTIPLFESPVLVDSIKRKELMMEGRAVSSQDSGEETVSFVSNGRAIPHHTVQIKDPSSEKVLDERQVGEVCVSGASVTPFYYHESKNVPPRKELRTGDLGYLVNGNLYIVDRLKDMIQIAGVNYYPSDIESQVERVAGIRPGRVIAFGIPNKDTGTESLVIVAERDKDPAKNIDDEPLNAQIRSRIYEACGLIPHDIVLSDNKVIPLTSSGKLMRRKCRSIYLEKKGAFL